LPHVCGRMTLWRDKTVTHLPLSPLFGPPLLTCTPLLSQPCSLLCLTSPHLYDTFSCCVMRALSLCIVTLSSRKTSAGFVCAYYVHAHINVTPWCTSNICVYTYCLFLFARLSCPPICVPAVPLVGSRRTRHEYHAHKSTITGTPPRHPLA
jgi:hypothetical protein